jgi:hypothetical protein
MAHSDHRDTVDAQLKNLRSSISDLGYEVDSYKTKTAAALGSGVFLLLLAAGSAYDLIFGRGGVWLMVGLDRATLIWITCGLGSIAAILLLLGFRRLRHPDIGVRTKLDQMEQQYAELVERGNASTRKEP